MIKIGEYVLKKVSKEDLYEFYINQNYTLKECSKKFNVNYTSLSALLKYYNIKKPKELIQARTKETKLIKYGSETYNNGDRAAKTNLTRYGKKSPLEIERIKAITTSPDVRQKAIATYAKNNNGNKVWNDGEVGLESWLPGQAERRYRTLKNNNSFNRSKPEDALYNELCSKYKIVYRNYYDKQRYPFHCDFYIPEEDLFIELNRFPTHYKEPFDQNNNEHIKLLEHCKTSPNNWIEEQMVKVWAGSDVLKLETAKKNKLNYLVIY